MNAEIISVGSELLLGQIANTNAQFISKQLADIGVNVYYHTAVGDNARRLTSVIRTAQSRSNLIIFTGGLGPTKDDLTKETIANVLQKQLVLHEEAYESIIQYFKQVNREMTPNNRKQAVLLEGSYVFKNDFGMAPGMGLHVDGITYVLLPGPPKELNPMVTTYTIPYLVKELKLEDSIHSRVLRFFGIGESKLETELADLLESQTNPTIAPLAEEDEVTIRITAKAQTKDVATKLISDMESKILKRVGSHFYGYDEATLQKECFKLLQQTGYTIAAAESLTGGMFSQIITSLPSSSQVFKGGIVAYSNEVKHSVLNVPNDILTQFGAVSEQCATQMAENIRVSCQSDIGISFTGVAGPSQSESKPVGLVYIGIAIKGERTKVYELNFAGSRNRIQNRTVKSGLYYLWKNLNKKRKI